MKNMYEYIIPAELKNPGIDECYFEKVQLQEADGKNYFEINASLVDNNISAIQAEVRSQLEIVDSILNQEGILSEYPNVIVCHRNIADKKEIFVARSMLKTERSINWLD